MLVSISELEQKAQDTDDFLVEVIASQYSDGSSITNYVISHLNKHTVDFPYAITNTLYILNKNSNQFSEVFTAKFGNTCVFKFLSSQQ